MNQFLKKAFVLFVLFSSISVFAQKGNYDREPSMPFQPMFSFGTAYHSFQGDIMGPATNTLLGNMGYRAGMRLNISKNIDASLLFSNTSFYEKNDEASFKSDVDAIGLHLGYTLNSVFKQSRISPYLTGGVQSLSFKTSNPVGDKSTDRESTIAIPLGLGLRLNISERIDLDATFNYTIAMGDIDKSVEEAADKFMSASFTIHYDLFTPKPKEIPFDDSYYADVNFKEMDVEDEDGDLVADVDDYCPKTPIGVKVNQFGCPLDGDNDGIPDYIDQEKNTRSGAVVDENGVQLTDEKYHSMYSDYEAASREYANFYNENEIKRENYKTTDEYLIAKANAFNKAYNEGEEFNNTVAALKYKVKIGAFSDGVPANVINKYLSLDDLESIPQDNGVVIYAVGTYNTLDDALSREYELEAKGFNETSILVDNNGVLSDYAMPIPESVIDEDEIVVAPISEEIEAQVEKEKKVVEDSINNSNKGNIMSEDKSIFDKLYESVMGEDDEFELGIPGDDEAGLDAGDEFGDEGGEEVTVTLTPDQAAALKAVVDQLPSDDEDELGDEFGDDDPLADTGELEDSVQEDTTQTGDGKKPGTDPSDGGGKTTDPAADSLGGKSTGDGAVPVTDKEGTEQTGDGKKTGVAKNSGKPGKQAV